MKKSGFLYLAVALAAIALIGLHPAPSGAADCTSICQNCHTAVAPTGIEIPGTYHLAGAGAPVMCIECHQQNYVDCTTSVPAHSGADWTANIVPIACVGCHGLSTCGDSHSVAELTPFAAGMHGATLGACAACHTINQTTEHHEGTCLTCHDAGALNGREHHEGVLPATTNASCATAACHPVEGASPIGHALGPGTPSLCTQCHEEPGGTVTAATTCIQCHNPPVGEAPSYSTAELQAMIDTQGIHQTNPDLIVSALSLSATTVNVGDTLAITDTTKNQGYAAAGASTTSFYLSADAVYDGGDTLLGSRTPVPALAPGATSSGTTTSAAIPASAGANMYIIAKADAGSAVTETNEANNTMYKAIRVVKPDLVVTALSFSATVNAGDTVAITDTTKNQGLGAAGASTTSFYLSSDTVLSAGDTLLSLNRSVSALGPGASETSAPATSVNIPIGTTAGYKYIIAKADNGAVWNDAGVVGESNENNNTKYKAIKVVKPDLVVSALSLSATTVAIGGTINVTDTTRNNGTGAAVASTTRFYLSSDTVLGAGDTEIGAGRAVPALTAFVSACTTCLSTAITGVPIPVVPVGYYYVIAEADADSPEDVVESNETNNTKYSASKIRITP